jgi:alpha-L-rhamnosidase
VIELPANQPIQRATFLLTADDRFQLFINGHPAGNGSRKEVANTDVTSLLQPGSNLIGIEATNDGKNPNPAGLVGRLIIFSGNAEPLIVPIDSSWQTSREATPNWNASDFNASAWKPAAQVAHFGDSSFGKIALNILDPAPFFRKPFTVDKPFIHEARRLKELERENNELKKMLAESLLKNRVLEAVCEKKL